jgi:hypothetical protein
MSNEAILLLIQTERVYKTVINTPRFQHKTLAKYNYVH